MRVRKKYSANVEGLNLVFVPYSWGIIKDIPKMPETSDSAESYLLLFFLHVHFMMNAIRHKKLAIQLIIKQNKVF